MLFSHNKIQIDVYINYNNDNVQHEKLVAEPGISALDALEGAVAYTQMKVPRPSWGIFTAIDGFKVDINHFGFIISSRKPKVVCRIFCKLDSPVIPHIINPYP